MKKLYALAAALVAVPVLAFAVPAFADSPGQLSNSPTNYKVRNVTMNSDYAQSVNAACNEIVKYSVILSNSDYGKLTNLTVRANMATGAISASAKNAVGNTTSVSGSAKVNTAGTLEYIAGSTVRIAEDAVTKTAVADGVTTTNGVNVGDLNGSTAIYIQWQAKVNCEQPPKEIQVCELATKKIITIKENQFDATKHSKNLSDCAKTPGDITVCELATKKIVTIKEDQFDSSKHSKNLADCAAPGSMVVCELETGDVVTIKEDQFDSEVYSRNLTDCEVTPEVPEEETPEVLVNTGAGDVLGLFAAVTVAGAIAHRLFWVRRNG